MKIIIKENTWLLPKTLTDIPGFKMEFGWGNGYALIPRGHKYYGNHYDTIPVNAHGGLTFGRFLNGKALKFYGLSKRHLGKWMVGFDTCHYMDTPQSCPREYVIQQARFLAEQLKNLNK